VEVGKAELLERTEDGWEIRAMEKRDQDWDEDFRALGRPAAVGAGAGASENEDSLPSDADLDQYLNNQNDFWDEKVTGKPAGTTKRLRGLREAVADEQGEQDAGAAGNTTHDNNDPANVQVQTPPPVNPAPSPAVPPAPVVPGPVNPPPNPPGPAMPPPPQNARGGHGGRGGRRVRNTGQQYYFECPVLGCQTPCKGRIRSHGRAQIIDHFRGHHGITAIPKQTGGNMHIHRNNQNQVIQAWFAANNVQCDPRFQAEYQ
jgi:hypothetical protein